MAALGADRHVLDVFRGRVDLTRNDCRPSGGQRSKARLKLVEDKANGPAVIQSLRHEIGGLVEVTPQGCGRRTGMSSKTG